MIALAFTALSASAATIGGFGARPAHPSRDDLATRAYFIIHSAAGRTVREETVVTNDGAKPLVLKVNGVDGLTGVTSGVVYANGDVTAHGAGRWILPESSRIVVPARSSIDVPFLVSIPRYARPGDHLGGIAFEAQKPTTSGGDFSVTVDVRTVVGVEIELPGPTTRQIRLLAIGLAPLPGTSVPSAVVKLEDEGGLLCHPRLTVALTGRDMTRTITQTLGTILPRDVIAYPFRWPGALSEGRYIISARATHCGRAQTMRTIAAYSPTATPTSTATPTTVAPTAPLANPSSPWTWWLIALIALGGMLGGAGIVQLARRRRTPRTKTPGAAASAASATSTATTAVAAAAADAGANMSATTGRVGSPRT